MELTDLREATTANVYPNEESGETTLGRSVLDRITRPIPNMTIDWERGERAVRRRLDDLRKSGTPDVIMAGYERYRGNVPYIEISYEDCPGLLIYSTVWENGVDLQIAPRLDVPVLSRAANQLAAALEFEYSFSVDFGGSFSLDSRKEDFPSFEAGAHHRQVRNGSDEFEEISPGETFEPLESGWQEFLRSSILRWHQEYDGHENRSLMRYQISDPRHLHSLLVDYLDSISPVERGWLVRFRGQPWIHKLYFEQGEWKTAVHFNGYTIIDPP